MKLRTKISIMGLLLVLLTAVSIVGIAFHQKDVLKENISSEVDQLIQGETKKVAQNVYLLCRTMQESLQQKDNAALRRSIMDIQVGKTGYVAVLGGKGDQRGHYIISKGGQRDEENLLVPSAQPECVTAIEEMIEKALALPRADEGSIPVYFHRYQWQNLGEKGMRAKLAAVTYFEPWDWVILASAYEDDFLEAQLGVADALSHTIRWVTWVALAIIVLALIMSCYIARGISKPLEKAIVVFGRIGRGELDAQLNLADGDEIGQLSRAFNAMVDNLRHVTASRDELNREIVRRSRVERELRKISARRKELETIVNNSPTVVFLWRAAPGWPVEYVSENVAQFGFTAGEFMSGERLFASILHPEDMARIVAEMDHYRDTADPGHFCLEFRLIDAGGEVCWVEIRVWPRHDGLGLITHYQGVLLDVTARKLAEATVHKLAYYDHLTGLPNRTMLRDRLDQAMAQAERDERHVALLFLDLDGFKEVNDLWGHAFGDLLLKAVGQRLNSCLRKNDTLARFGGDEFVILLQGIGGPSEVEVVARKIVEAVSRPFALEGEQVKVTTSVGIAIFPQDGTDADTLLKKADVAMYAAKERGRNGYCFFISGERTGARG